MTRTSRLVIAFGINVCLSVGLVLAGHVAHSTSLVADAGHNLTDAMAILIALVATIVSLRPPSDRRSYGYGRATILAALVNGVVLTFVTISIVWLGVSRLLHPQLMHGGVVVIAATFSLLANLVVVWLLMEGSDDMGIQSALLHSVSDSLSAFVVIIAGFVALFASGPVALRVDPVATLIVAGFIVVEAIRITKESLHVLLEGVPTDIDVELVRQCLCSLEEIESVHDLHIWSLSSSHRVLSAHLVVKGDPTASATAPLIARTRHLLDEQFSIDHATLEIEIAPCSPETSHL